MKRASTTRGFTLVEMIIYIAILTLVFMVITTTLLSFTSSYRVLSVRRAIEHSAIESLERMTRDIRAAASIDTGNSSLGVSPGVLTIIGPGNATTTKFHVQDGILAIDVNGVYKGPITTSDVTITNLTFNQLTTTYSKAVKIDMTLQAARGSVIETKTYHTTVILKGV